MRCGWAVESPNLASCSNWKRIKKDSEHELAMFSNSPQKIGGEGALLWTPRVKKICQVVKQEDVKTKRERTKNLRVSCPSSFH
jgi:hypothetical protein